VYGKCSGYGTRPSSVADGQLMGAFDDEEYFFLAVCFVYSAVS
jgi:hypothetical protein